MAIKDVVAKIRRALLCCGSDDRKRSLEISSPTDVQRGVLDMPGLTDEQRHFIREKASTDAARLLSLTSHPPTRPSSNPPSTIPSPASSRSPSVALLNSASANLPTTLPTPPRQKHTEAVPPTSAHSRMKGFWESTRRLSNTLSTNSHNGYRDLREDDVDKDEGVVLLNMDFKDSEPNSPVSVKTIDEGFVSQNVLIGGTPTKPSNKPREDIIAKAIQDTENGSSNSSDDEERSVRNEAIAGEHTPLAKA